MDSLADMTQVLLGLKNENEENTEETIRLRTEFNKFNQNIFQFFKEEKRRREGDGLEAAREASKGKAGGGVGLFDFMNDLKTTPEKFSAGLGAGIGGLFGIISGLIQEFIVNFIVRPFQFFFASEEGKASKIGMTITKNLKEITDFIRYNAFTRFFMNLKVSFMQGFEGMRPAFKNAEQMVNFGFQKLSKPAEFLGRMVAGIQRFFMFFVNIGVRIFSPFVNATMDLIKFVTTSFGDVTKGKGPIGKILGPIAALIQGISSGTFTFFKLIARVLFWPINFIIGAVAAYGGIVDGFEAAVEVGRGKLSAVLGGLIEAIKRIIQALFTKPFDLVLYAVGWVFDKLVKLITFGNFETNLRGLLGSLTTDFVEVAFNFINDFFDNNPIGRAMALTLDKVFGVLTGIGFGIYEGIKAAFTGRNPIEAFRKEFNKRLEDSGGFGSNKREGFQLRGENMVNANRIAQILEEATLERTNSGQGSGGNLVMSNDTNINNDNSTSLSMGQEQPVDNQDQMERYARRGRNRRN